MTLGKWSFTSWRMWNNNTTFTVQCYLHHLYMAKLTLTSMMQTKHNQLHKFSTLEEQFTIGKCEQFKGFSSLRYSRQFLKRIYKYSTLKTNLSRKASKSHYLGPYAPGTSRMYTSDTCVRSVYMQQIQNGSTDFEMCCKKRQLLCVNTLKFWLKFNNNNNT